MLVEQFRSGLAAIFEIDPDALDARLRQGAADWDSVEVLSAIALIDQLYSVTVPAGQLVRAGSVANLLKLVRRSQEDDPESQGRS